MRTTIKSGLLLALAAALALAGTAAAPAPADGPNLLQNPSFEAPFVKQCCEDGIPIGEVQVAHDWLGWWLQPNQDAQHPSAGATIAWHRPEWREAACGPVCANRVRSGNDSQKYFTFFSVHDAGMYQQVSGLQPGALLRFSIYMQAWSTDHDYGPSSFVQHMGMRVGIDPFGGTNAFSPHVIWGSAFDTFDTWGLYTVQAAAQSGTVTVFTRSTPLYGSQHNDIYLDDASLVAVGSGSPVSIVAPAARPATPTPAPASTYIVQRGDNYYRIAQKFGISVDALYAVNHITNTHVLFIGTRLIIPAQSS